MKAFQEKVIGIQENAQNFNNVSKEECKALRDLKSYTDIVIMKEADKGLAVVVWGIDEYRKEAYRQLNEVEVY